MEATHDTLFGGRVILHQPARGAGYRANVDALLLAAFAAFRVPPSGTRVAFDLGAGAGAVSLALLHLGVARRVVLVEIDADAVRFARANLEANGWSDRGEVVSADVARAAREYAGEASLVVCNPPYFEPGRGRAASHPARARARSGELEAFVEAACLLAGKRARACFVYPARELATLLATLRGAGLEPKRMRMVRATAESPARVVLIEAVRGKPGGLDVAPDLIERDDTGYSPELTALLSREGGRA